MDTDPEFTFTTVTVTCHTDGCENADIPIELEIIDSPDPQVMCGPCEQPITDITPAQPPEQEEPPDQPDSV